MQFGDYELSIDQQNKETSNIYREKLPKIIEPDNWNTMLLNRIECNNNGKNMF